MNYKISIHRKAEIEYDAAYAWYSQEKKGLEEDFFIAVNKRLQQILAGPELFSVKSSDCREAVVNGFPYTIVYRINKKIKLINVIAIHHTRRKPVKNTLR